MTNNEETPETQLSDEAVVAQLQAAAEAAGGESPQAEPCDCGVDHEAIPGLDSLMDYLMEKFGEMQFESPETRAHDERMKVVGQSMRDSMSAADETLAEEFQHDRLAWGLWKSSCGCIHLGLPDGKGGWATRPEELEQVATSVLMKEVVQALAATGQVVLELVQGLEEEGR